MDTREGDGTGPGCGSNVTYSSVAAERRSVTREAAAEGFDSFADELADRTYQEFDAVAALTGASGPGSRVVDRLVAKNALVERRVVRPELQAFRDDASRQFDHVLDYAGDPSRSFQAVADDVLAADSFYDALRTDLPEDRRARLREQILDRHQALGDAVVPLVRSDADAFWPAIADAFEVGDALQLVEEHFTFADPVRSNPDAFRFQTEIDPGVLLGGALASGLPSVTVEYTDQALTAMRRAEAQVVEDTKREVRERFGD